MKMRNLFACTFLVAQLSATVLVAGPVDDEIDESNKVFVESVFETKCEGEDAAKCAMIKVVNSTFQGQTCEVTIEYLGGDICDGATLRRATVGGIEVGRKAETIATKRIIPSEVPIKICSISNATIQSCEDDGLWDFNYIPNGIDHADGVKKEHNVWEIPEILPGNEAGRSRRPEISGTDMSLSGGGYMVAMETDLSKNKREVLQSDWIDTSMQILDLETVKLLQKEKKKFLFHVDFDYELKSRPRRIYNGEVNFLVTLSCRVGGDRSSILRRYEKIATPARGTLTMKAKGVGVEACESPLWLDSLYFGNFARPSGDTVMFWNSLRGFRWKIRLAESTGELE